MLQCPKCLTIFDTSEVLEGQDYYCTHCASRLGLKDRRESRKVLKMFGIVLLPPGEITFPHFESQWSKGKMLKEEEEAQTFAATWTSHIEKVAAEYQSNLQERRSHARHSYDQDRRDQREQSKGVRLDGPSPAAGDCVEGRPGGPPEGHGPRLDISGGEARRSEGRSADRAAERSAPDLGATPGGPGTVSGGE